MSARDLLAALLARHAPRGAVRVAEALAAVAMNRRRRAARLWNGAFPAPALETVFAALPTQPISVRADPAWASVCRRIAARALADAGPDPTRGALWVAARNAAPPTPDHAPPPLRLGAYAFYRAREIAPHPNPLPKHGEREPA